MCLSVQTGKWVVDAKKGGTNMPSQVCPKPVTSKSSTTAASSRASAYARRGGTVCSPTVWMLCSQLAQDSFRDCFHDCRSHKSSCLCQEATSFWQVYLRSFATGCRSLQPPTPREEEQFAPLPPLDLGSLDTLQQSAHNSHQHLLRLQVLQEQPSLRQVCLTSIAHDCRLFKSSRQRPERRSSLLPYPPWTWAAWVA